MAKWLISAPEVWRRNYEVEADTYDEAVDQITEGTLPQPDGSMTFSSFLDPEESVFMVLEGPEDENGDPLP